MSAYVLDKYLISKVVNHIVFAVYQGFTNLFNSEYLMSRTELKKQMQFKQYF